MVRQFISFQNASIDDVSVIVQMLIDDPLGSKRERFETPLPEYYIKAFHSINNDPNKELFIASISGEIVGLIEITFIPYLTYQGSWRVLIEGVRDVRKYRNLGVGKQMLEWAINCAKEKGCHMVQLTTDKRRSGAIKFYEALGFQATHEGMKLHQANSL